MEWNPEDYASNSHAQLEWARELIARLALEGHEILLDVGAGDGRVSSELARRVPDGRVLGIDRSAAFVAYARAHYTGSEHPNLSFLQVDARNIDLEERFDVVFSNAALHWVDDQPAFLGGAARALKPSGRLMVSCGGAGNAADVVHAMDAVRSRGAWEQYFRDFRFPYFFHAPSDYEAWIEGAGFKPVRLALVEKDMTHDGREGLRGWLRTTWMPYFHRVPEALRVAFLDECIDTYLAVHPLDTSGRSHVTMVRLEIQAHL